MSKSSRAAIGGLYGGAMRHAAPTLFWLSLLLFVVTLASYYSVFIPSENDQTDPATRAWLIFGGVAHALNNFVLPFAGAAIIWAVKNSGEGEAQ